MKARRNTRFSTNLCGCIEVRTEEERTEPIRDTRTLTTSTTLCSMWPADGEQLDTNVARLLGEWRSFKSYLAGLYTAAKPLLLIFGLSPLSPLLPSRDLSPLTPRRPSVGLQTRAICVEVNQFVPLSFSRKKERRTRGWRRGRRRDSKREISHQVAAVAARKNESDTGGDIYIYMIRNLTKIPVFAFFFLLSCPARKKGEK